MEALCQTCIHQLSSCCRVLLMELYTLKLLSKFETRTQPETETLLSDQVAELHNKKLSSYIFMITVQFNQSLDIHRSNSMMLFTKFQNFIYKKTQKNKKKRVACGKSY